MQCDVSLLKKAIKFVSEGVGDAEKASDDAADCASGAAEFIDAADVGAVGGAKCNDTHTHTHTHTVTHTHTHTHTHT